MALAALILSIINYSNTNSNNCNIVCNNTCNSTCINGTNGRDGLNGTNGRDGLNGTCIQDCINGTNGRDGLNGTCPQECTNGTNGRDGLNGTCIQDCINGTNGRDGLNGTCLQECTNGTNGLNGINGTCLQECTNGTNGRDGLNGTNGLNGLNGTCLQECTNGTNGLNGLNGTCLQECTNGTNGINGTDSFIDFADFYALMPPDNSATVAAGADVQFPELGPTKISSGIFATSVTQFQLSSIGTYDVSFFISIDEAGQLEVTLNNIALPQTVTGRAINTNYISASLLINTTTINSILTIRNPAGNPTALTCTPTAGGTHSVSAHLRIIRLI